MHFKPHCAGTSALREWEAVKVIDLLSCYEPVLLTSLKENDPSVKPRTCHTEN